MTTLQVLTNAMDLVKDPADWTQWEFAENEIGRAVKPGDPGAVCFCVVGAVMRASLDLGFGNYPDDALEALDDAAGDFSPATINDCGTHADVMALMGRAIETEEAKL